MHTKIEKPRKTFWEWWIARDVMVRIKVLLKNVRIIFKKMKSVSGPFSFFFFYNKLKQLCDKSQTQRYINLILITDQF